MRWWMLGLAVASGAAVWSAAPAAPAPKPAATAAAKAAATAAAKPAATAAAKPAATAAAKPAATAAAKPAATAAAAVPAADVLKCDTRTFYYEKLSLKKEGLGWRVSLGSNALWKLSARPDLAAFTKTDVSFPAGGCTFAKDDGRLLKCDAGDRPMLDVSSPDKTAKLPAGYAELRTEHVTHVSIEGSHTTLEAVLRVGAAGTGGPEAETRVVFDPTACSLGGAPPPR